jgi:proline dehydrogenase
LCADIHFLQTALLPNATSLVNFSAYLISRRRQSGDIAFPGHPTYSDLDVLYDPKANTTLSKEDIAAVRQLHEDLVRICQRAQERGVKIIIDAEYR